MSNKWIGTIAIVAVLAAGTVNASTIVTNGDFSQNAAAFTAYPGYFGEVAAGNPTAASVNWQLGWGVSGVGSTLNPGATPWAPTSAGDFTSWGFMQGSGKLSQEVSLVAGQEYTMSFSLAQSHWDDVNAGRAAGIVQIADGVAAGLVGRMVASDEINGDGFTTFSVPFTALAAPSGHWYMEIYNTPTGDAPSLLVTGLSITPVATPEPGAVCMLVSALIGLACYAWRRRK